MQKTILKTFRDYFLTGLLVALPLGITLYFSWWVISTLDKSITPLLPWQNLFENTYDIYIPGYGLFVLILSLIGIGFLAKGFFGKLFVRFSERILGKMPVVRGIYSTAKQISQAVLQKDGHTFREVALIPFPGEGTWCLCFVVGTPLKAIKNKLKDNNPVTVFLPTTPNPTSGYLLFVSRDHLIPLDISVETGLKLVVSAGIVHTEA